jgi:Glycosyltransferases involved in cell wall biogenesis
MSCKVSVIICTHNPDHTIFSRCLEAVARLQPSRDIESEIIVVDNRSSTLNLKI